MSYRARIFRVLIASPSDVEDERIVAVKTIQEWNDLHSADRRVALLPVRWETHSAPEHGERPQGILNRQIVHDCDLVIGIFWTKIGTPTGKADSGTLEEIEQASTKGKKVMLYFSKSKRDPDLIDIDQLHRLRELKRRTMPNSLIETYADLIEFRDKISRQIEIQVRALISEQSAEDLNLDFNGGEPSTDILFEFADPKTGESIGKKNQISLNTISIPDFKDIPDYQPHPEERIEKDEDGGDIRIFEDPPYNRNYYRQRAANLIQRSTFTPLRFYLKNLGTIGAKDLFIDIEIKSKSPGIMVVKRDFIPKSRPGRYSEWSYEDDDFPTTIEQALPKPSDSVRMNIEIPALQPKRIVSPEMEFLIGSRQSTTVTFQALLYADTFSQPLEHSITMEIAVDTTEHDARDVVAAFERDSQRVAKLD